MPTEIPVTFRVDACGSIVQQLQDDTFATIMKYRTQFASHRISRLTNRAAEFLSNNRHITGYSEMALLGSAAIACAAFMASDLPQPYLDRTMSAASYGSIYDLLDCCKDTSPDSGYLDNYELLEQVSAAGNVTHPEFHHATDILMDYFTSTTLDAKAGQLAIIGAGILMRQFDMSWHKVRGQAIDDICLQETDGIAWESILES